MHTCRVGLGELHSVFVYFKSNTAEIECGDGYIDKNPSEKTD